MLNSKKRILCISDSLGLPREGVDYTDTWFAQLKLLNNSFDFISIFRRNETTDCLSTESYNEYLLWYKPYCVVLQLGICDCSPRYMKVSSLLYKIVYRLPSKLKSFFWKYYKKTHKRSIDKADVSLKQFEQNLYRYFCTCEAFELNRLVIIKIATPTQVLIDANPPIVEAVRQYNEIIDSVAEKFDFCIVINPFEDSDSANFLADGYHPNVLGNSILSSMINAVISI